MEGRRPGAPPQVGSAVQVWSTSQNGFCQAHVQEVDGDQVTVVWFDPITDAPMQKRLPMGHGQLLWPIDGGAANAAHHAVVPEHPYKEGMSVEVWSNSNEAWLKGVVEVATPECVSVLLKLPSGTMAKKDLPPNHSELRRYYRPVCEAGTKCPQRTDEEHLAQFAHPFDQDYAECCKFHGVEAVQPSLWGLFEWMDTDNSGKVSRAELEKALPLLSKMRGESMQLSDSAWKALDDDGNGAVNFGEFASWAGPRFGLPLGVQHLFRGGSTSSSFIEQSACGICGCPCTGFEPRPESKLKRFQDTMEEGALWNAGLRLVWDWGGGRELCETMSRNLATCKCGHKQSAHRKLLGGEIPCPRYWRASSGGARGFVDFVPLDYEAVTVMQQVFDRTHKGIWTRDRRKHQPPPHNVPKKYHVVRALRCENTKNWQSYHVRRGQLVSDFAEKSGQDVHIYRDVKSTVALNELAQPYGPDHATITECNEWYLFHGTTPDAAQSICKNNIKISLAGGNTGSLYGRGVYLAESITKADEYSSPNSLGEFAVLICRALGGRVRYTDEIEPDPEDLVSSCIEGPYDSVLGDREKCRKTYREFIFFDAENIYPEYIVHYVREF